MPASDGCTVVHSFYLCSGMYRDLLGTGPITIPHFFIVGALNAPRLAFLQLCQVPSTATYQMEGGVDKTHYDALQLARGI